MKPCCILPLAVATALLVTGCASYQTTRMRDTESELRKELKALQQRFAPDSHLAVFTIGIEPRNGGLVLTGDVDRVEARLESLRTAERLGVKIEDRIRVLPDAALGETNWGITTLSVANGREGTGHSSELGTQTLMGEVVRVLKRQGRWLYVQTSDQYLSWMESGSVRLCTRAVADEWQQSPLLIVTDFEQMIREGPTPDAPPVSDVVIGCRVKQVSESGDWFKIELPDGRSGYLPKASATDYVAWKAARQPTPANIERSGRQFIGRPYLWGASTPRGMDCSGFTKLTFFLNGIELHRNASQQARQGVEVPLDRDLSQLNQGDLLFFGFEDRGERRGRITHVGIYLGDKLFIQSSGRVRISSLDPQSPLADPGRIRGLIKARRILSVN
jgi:cell wall-associated NlpC family hydrolase